MKKIMFNDQYGLTKAVIDGRKTMTRRIVHKSVELKRAFAVIFDEPHGTKQEEYMKSARYSIGEIVAVAQSYNDIHCCGYAVDSRFDPFRTEDWDGDKGKNGKLKAHKGWNNKMYVKAGLMPYHIKITGIRIERLQEISDEDCLREGIEFSHMTQSYYVDSHKETGGKAWLGRSPRDAISERRAERE